MILIVLDDFSDIVRVEVKVLIYCNSETKEIEKMKDKTQRYTFRFSFTIWPFKKQVNLVNSPQVFFVIFICFHRVMSTYLQNEREQQNI